MVRNGAQILVIQTLNSQHRSKSSCRQLKILPLNESDELVHLYTVHYTCISCFKIGFKVAQTVFDFYRSKNIDPIAYFYILFRTISFFVESDNQRRTPTSYAIL